MKSIEALIKQARARLRAAEQEVLKDWQQTKAQIEAALRKVEALHAEGRIGAAYAVIDAACDVEYEFTGETEIAGPLADQLEEELGKSEDEDE